MHYNTSLSISQCSYLRQATTAVELTASAKADAVQGTDESTTRTPALKSCAVNIAATTKVAWKMTAKTLNHQPMSELSDLSGFMDTDLCTSNMPKGHNKIPAGSYQPSRPSASPWGGIPGR